MTKTSIRYRAVVTVQMEAVEPGGRLLETALEKGLCGQESMVEGEAKYVDREPLGPQACPPC